MSIETNDPLHEALYRLGDILGEIEARAEWTAKALEELHLARINGAEFSSDFERVFTDGALLNLRTIGDQSDKAWRSIWRAINDAHVDQTDAHAED